MSFSDIILNVSAEAESLADLLECNANLSQDERLGETVYLVVGLLRRMHLRLNAVESGMCGDMEPLGRVLPAREGGAQ
ncbi:MAG: hypothetical protein AB7D37_04580 [Desulfovibrio sp.]